MKYLLVGLINAIYGILLLLTLASDTPGFAIVAGIGTLLTVIGISGCVLYIIKIIKQNRGEVADNTQLNNWFGLVKTFDIVLVIGLLFRALIIQPFVVDGVSMETNFHNSEGLLVDKISYHFRDPIRGDVIIFQAPKNPSDDYIKRIIGLPGETVTITSGKVYINNQLLIESYLTPGLQTISGSETKFSKTLGSNEYFVMGDNRTDSSDSREWGAMPRQNIIGKAWLVVYPISQKGFVINPNPTLNTRK